MFIASALLKELEIPSRLSRLALTALHTVAIGESGVLRVWDDQCKLHRVHFDRRLVAVDLHDDVILLGTAAGTICIGQVESELHDFRELELPGTSNYVHAVRVVQSTDNGVIILACVGDVVYLLQIPQDGEVRAVCGRPFKGYTVQAIRAIRSGEKIILLASSPIRGQLRVARSTLQTDFSNVEPWAELVTWEKCAAHLHDVLHVLDIDMTGKVLVECDGCALAVVDGLTGRIFCHSLVCGGTRGVPGGIGCLFDHGGKTLIFWSSANLPELVGASETLESPLFPHIVSSEGAVGFIWSDETNSRHAIVRQEYDPNAGPSTASSSAHSSQSDLMTWNDFGKDKQRELPRISSVSDARDDFYRPGCEDQDRPLDDVIDELHYYAENDGNAKAADEIICYFCEAESDVMSSEE